MSYQEWLMCNLAKQGARNPNLFAENRRPWPATCVVENKGLGKTPASNKENLRGPARGGGNTLTTDVSRTACTKALSE